MIQNSAPPLIRNIYKDNSFHTAEIYRIKETKSQTKKMKKPKNQSGYPRTSAESFFGRFG